MATAASTDPKDIVIPNVQKVQEVEEEETIEPCCSKLMSFFCFGIVGITFFTIFTTVTSVLVFANGRSFCNNYVRACCFYVVVLIHGWKADHNIYSGKIQIRRVRCNIKCLEW